MLVSKTGIWENIPSNALKIQIILKNFGSNKIRDSK